MEENTKIAKIDYKKFIEDNFLILDQEKQTPVPFILKPVQNEYLSILEEEYSEMEGVREIILKARQEGFSSLILALFTVDFILRPYSVSICVSHKRDATELLFKKVKFYLESFCQKNGIAMKDYLSSETKGMIENRVNDAVFYIQTAGSKVGGRGGSARNLHFSEGAFYSDTELITAEEMLTATAQQVPQGFGMIFIESTANGEGNYYQKEWERAYTDHVSSYKPRFFGWEKYYSPQWIEEKRKEFASEAKFKQEYPRTPEEAFISSGSPYFRNDILDLMLATAKQKFPMIQSGMIMPDGNFNG